ncbi:MAG: cupin domain-containing protein [Solirubrobacteraceae bacterium]
MPAGDGAGFRFVDASEVEAMWGAFRKMRIALGVTGFGINQLELPPGGEGRTHSEHDSGQQEVYVILAGSGTMRFDDDSVELVPGRWLVVEPGCTRTPVAGSDGLTMIMVGGMPDAGYVPRQNL